MSAFAQFLAGHNKQLSSLLVTINKMIRTTGTFCPIIIRLTSSHANQLHTANPAIT
jgi:hypothetical protein